ncbi:glutamine synthetase family protein [Pseudogemmobacter bohemicus]|uniref:glutamine synthetase family protein n=1 Tax=Pseudogemmobacter bohemicus TaxID=2250708 RepID=UPI000DD4B8B4|nr:glutamine synthetase [Pseudogemmobacter bohemicus]
MNDIPPPGDDFAMLGYVDLDGLIRGKYATQAKLRSWQEKGGAFCSVVLGWDSRDALYSNRHTGWHTGYHDDPIRVVPGPGRVMPGDGRRFHLIEYADGPGAALCPRRLAGRVLEEAAAMGFTAMAGFEYEFYVFRETPATALAKGYRGLTALSPTTGGYSVQRMAVEDGFFSGMMALARQLNTPLEAIHPEAGEGAMEFAFTPSEPLEAADRAAIFKSFSKAWGNQNGLSLCYMAKPLNGLPGCGGHTHLSLWRGDRSAFYDPAGEGALSETALHFIAGQLKYMPELLALYAPTINSFTRLAPGFWAPTGATWGFDNRTCSLRVVGDSAKSIRVEMRPPAADANPYLVLAAALASGLQGIREGLDPGPALRGNGYEADLPAERRFPASLAEAAARLRGSEMARAWFGDAFPDHFATSREAEVAAQRAWVSDWELNRYFEMI